MTTLLCRSFTIVSDYHKLHKEIVELKSVLRENCCNTLPSLTLKPERHGYECNLTLTREEEKTSRNFPNFTHLSIFSS